MFRSLGIDKDELEKRIYEWNGKNKVPLKEGYVRTQLSWSYRNKIVPPPNFDKDYYKGIGIIPTDEELQNESESELRRISLNGTPKGFLEKFLMNQEDRKIRGVIARDILESKYRNR